MEFTLNRDHTVSSTTGHTIKFVKDEPTYVPREMRSAVMAIGAIAVKDAKDVIVEEVKKGAEPETEDERDALVFKAFATMMKRSKRGDFTAAGTPHAGALKDVLGFAVDAAVIKDLWIKFQVDGGDGDE